MVAPKFRIVYAQVPVAEIKGRIIRNPAYGGPTVSIFGWHWIPQQPRTSKVGFAKALKESIKKEGLRNPVVIYALDEGCFISFGSSRLLAARELELEFMPAIVNDYCNKFPLASEVTMDNFHVFFKDVPKYFEITETGADTHYSLERNRRSTFDPQGFVWADGQDFIKKEFRWIDEND